MSNDTQSARSKSEAIFSLVLVLLAAVASCVAWRVTGALAYLVAGAGFVVLAPLWYRSPISLAALRRPIGARITQRREFTALDKLCTFFGYGLVLVAVGLGVFAK
jgi:hypothetical protein